MHILRRSGERGHADHGWLDTHYTFSFSDYYDPQFMGFRSLRVINEDRIAPGQGFGMHGHRNMEIVTYILEGELAHQDSLGNGETIRAGELQRMTAGRGIRHSEFNASKTDAAHLVQIWLLPGQQGLEPSYEQKAWSRADKLNRWRLVASPDAADGSLLIHQDARLSLAVIEPGKELEYPLAGRHAWLQVLRGNVNAGGEALATGDGLAVSDERQLVVTATDEAEVLLFDLA